MCILNKCWHCVRWSESSEQLGPNCVSDTSRYMNDQDISYKNVLVRWSEHLTSENGICGRIRPIDSNQCVTVLNKTDESDQIFTLINCEEGKIFCYNSTTRFIKLQDDERQCVTVEDNTPRLTACRKYPVNTRNWNDISWGYMWKDDLKLMSSPQSCWKLASDQKSLSTGSGACSQFDFQLIKSIFSGSPSLRVWLKLKNSLAIIEWIMIIVQ